ncbi:MAG: NTP transferase domain-containing protein [Planctomycetota bacterium]
MSKREAAPHPVYVLVGGAGRRFGGPKATAAIDGQPWAIDVGRRLACGEAFTLVGRCSIDKSAARRIDDAPLGHGPLSGLLAALEDREATFGTGWLALASCDLVWPDPAWLTPLLDERGTVSSKPRPIAFHAEDRWQPFPSLWHTSVLGLVAHAVDRGERTFQRLLGELGATRVCWLGPGATPPQANTAEELRRLAPDARLGQTAGSGERTATGSES